MLILSRAIVEELLDLDELVEAVAAAMADLSAGRASMPSRIAALVPEREALLGVMPAYLPSASALTTKLVSLFPRNAARGMPTHQAVIVVFDSETGTPAALLDGTYITAARTAAGSALATRLLARDDASVLAILGTGVQARDHARAVTRMRRFREIRVAGRDPARVRALADELSGRAMGSWQEALAGADVVCATTHSPEPVVRREWLKPGVHVNSVGVNPRGPEVDALTIADALVIVESRQQALAPPPAGAIELAGVKQVTEIGELLNGTKPGRASAEQITLYKSVGVAVQDAAAAVLVLRAARRRGLGLEVPI